MVQTRSKSSLSTNTTFVIPSSPHAITNANNNSNRIDKRSSNKPVAPPPPPLPPTLYKTQQEKQRAENALQLEDISSIPDPPTPPNPSTFQKSVAVAVAKAKRRRLSAAARRLSSNSKRGSIIPSQYQLGSVSHSKQKSDNPVGVTLTHCYDSNYVPRELSSNIGNTASGDGICKNQTVMNNIFTDLDCSNDSDMSIDVSIDQLPQPSPTHQHTDLIENRTKTSSICYDDSSHEQEEDKDNKKKTQKRRRHSMFQTKDKASSDNIYLDDAVVDGQEGERVNPRTNIYKKRNRRSIILPNEVDNEEEEEINSSRVVASKRRRKLGKGRRSLLLSFSENGENSTMNDTSSPQNSNAIWEKSSFSSSSTTISISATTHINVAHEELLEGKEVIPSTLNAEKCSLELGQEGKKQGKQQIVARNFAPIQIDNLNQMKIGIRKFCSIPLEERYKSEDTDILHITEIIGYPIISSIDKLRYQQEKIKDANNINDDASATSSLSLDWTSSPKNSQSTRDTKTRTRSATKKIEGCGVENFVVTNEMKRSIIGKMCPIIERMESRRKEEVALVEECTNCQVERKRGKYRYVSLSTGEKVSSLEYKQLYIEMVNRRCLELQQEKRKRSEVIARHTAVLQQKVFSESFIPNKQQGDQVISLECKEELNDSIKIIDNNLLAGEQVLCHEVNKTSSEEPQCVPEEEVATSMSEVCSSNNISITTEGTSKENENLDRRYSIDEEENLPNVDSIPSRDNTSPDPEIATLQIALFSKIDMVLQAYSDKVLKLQERRSELHILTDI